MRPDYVGAQKAFIDLAVQHLNGKQNISVADFCCGTGQDTKTLAGHVKIDKATLIDINKDFLRIAKEKDIGVHNIVTICSDILEADVSANNDLVISMFAYHHVPNNRKADYLKKAKEALKPGGLLLLGEIFMQSKADTLKYYEDLIASIPGSKDNPALVSFLRQTAQSDDFEFKVSKEYAYNQLKEAGFSLVESKKIWPLDGSLSADDGTFVEVWKSNITKLFLTSAGFTNSETTDILMEEIPKQAELCKVLMISCTQDETEESYVNESKNELRSLGFKDIKVLDLHKPMKPDPADIVYVCGGNTFAILQKMKETGVDKFIIDSVNKGALYIGVSAGSIMAGKTIEIAGWGSTGDKNEVGLKDLTGFGFTDVAVFPHYQTSQKDEVAEFKKRATYPVIEITDNQMVFVRDNKAKKIGRF